MAGLFDLFGGGDTGGGLYGDALTPDQLAALRQRGLLGFMQGLQKSGALDYTAPFQSGKVPAGFAAGLAGGLGGAGEAMDAGALNAMRAQQLGLQSQQTKADLELQRAAMKAYGGLLGGNGGATGAQPAAAQTAAAQPASSDTGLDTAVPGDNWEITHNNFGGLRIPGSTVGPKAGGFQAFASPEDGVAAISRQLDRYASGATTGTPLTTIRQIVSTWAPPSENPTATLIDRASKVVGIGPDQPLDLSDPGTKAKLIEATIRNEQGGKLPLDTALITKVAQAGAGVPAMTVGGGLLRQPPPAPPQTSLLPPSAPAAAPPGGAMTTPMGIDPRSAMALQAINALRGKASPGFINDVVGLQFEGPKETAKRAAGLPFIGPEETAKFQYGEAPKITLQTNEAIRQARTLQPLEIEKAAVAPTVSGEQTRLTQSQEPQKFGQYIYYPPGSQQAQNVANMTMRKESLPENIRPDGKGGVWMTSPVDATADKRQGSLVTQDIDRAIALSQQPGWFPASGGMSALTKSVPGMPAYNLNALLDTIKSNVAFQTLSEMRKSSPTGGALGQVSNQEENMLARARGNLEQSQDQKQFEFNLRRLKNIFLDVVNGSPEKLDQLLKEGKITQEQHDTTVGLRENIQNPTAARPSGVTSGGVKWSVQ